MVITLSLPHLLRHSEAPGILATTLAPRVGKRDLRLLRLLVRDGRRWWLGIWMNLIDLKYIWFIVDIVVANQIGTKVRSFQKYAPLTRKTIFVSKNQVLLKDIQIQRSLETKVYIYIYLYTYICTSIHEFYGPNQYSTSHTETQIQQYDLLLSKFCSSVHIK